MYYFDLLLFAIRELRRRRLRTWLTVVGILIGIMSVVSLLSLGQGLSDAVTEQFSSIGADYLIVRAQQATFAPPGAFTTADITKKDAKIIKGVPGVTFVGGRLMFGAEFVAGKESKSVSVVTIPSEAEAREKITKVNNYRFEYGRLPLEGEKGIVISKSFAENGFSKELRLNNKVKLKGEEFRIVGILADTSGVFSQGTNIIDESVARDLLGEKELYHVIVVEVDSGEDLEVMREKISEKLRSYRNVKAGKEDFTIETTEQVAASFNSILDAVNVVLVGIAGISLFVGGLGIMNTMYTAVLQRTREIAVIKSTGATNRSILFIFMAESAILGFVGGLMGILFGYLLGVGAAGIGRSALGTNALQASFPPDMILGALVFSTVIGLIAGYLPAKDAVRLDPAVGLRYE